jgi:predicted Zn-dependent protease
MGRAGYDPAQLSGVMAMLGQVTASGGGGPPEWLSTHPNPENREEAIREMAGTAEVALNPALVRREEYIRHLDGMVFGNNPREGFFEGSRFYHPDMGFLLDFPEGWQTGNSKQAVQSGSADGDAMLALTLAQGATPAAALNTFLSQEGMEAGPTSSAAINGIPAASADFRFTTADGVLRGRVEFINHRGTMLRFVGASPESAWGSRRGAAERSLESFRVLSDPGILAVQPARIRLVTLPRATELSSLLEQEGVGDRADVVRLLNRLQGNPTLPSGRILKIPMGGRLSGDG